MRFVCLLLMCFCALLGQNRYTTWNKEMDVCPKVVMDGPLRPGGSRATLGGTSAGMIGAAPVGEISWRTGVQLFPPDSRRDVGSFAALDESGKASLMASRKGKVIVVGFWSVGCEPSLFLLGELAQLAEKGASYGFEVFAVNHDPERWRVINRFLAQKRMQGVLKASQVYTPGLDANGVSVFMDELPALPAYFILDREGRLAAQAFGYRNGDLVKWLKVVLSEKAPPTPAGTP